MKKGIGVFFVILFALALITNYSIKNIDSSNVDLASLICLISVNAEVGYSCTVTTKCDALGSYIECTGVVSCSRGINWVKCDGKTTYC